MKLEKVLWVVVFASVIQTLAIIYLVSGVSNLNEVVTKQSELFFNPIESQSKIKDLNSQLYISDQKGMDVALLRQTIQQELNQYFQQHLKTIASTSSNLSEPLKVSSPENIQSVDHQLDLIIAEGGMSNNSFELFAADVSKLAPNDRRLALSRLAKAINSGQVITTN